MSFLLAALFAVSISLADHRGEHRVLLVFGPTAAVLAQTEAWDGEREGFAERDLVVLKASEAKNAGELTKKFDLEPGAFAVILLGKDGHVALRSSQPVAAEKLFALIDAMPMRRAEIQERR